MTPTIRIQRARDAAWSRVEEEVAILSMDANRIRLLNHVGGFLWERCDNTTVDALVDALCAHYAVDTDRARRDVLAFLDDLLKRGLITMDPAQ